MFKEAQMTYILATTETKVRWYYFDIQNLKEGQYTLSNDLDLKTISSFSDKESAKIAAQALGLKVWRYFKY